MTAELPQKPTLNPLEGLINEAEYVSKNAQRFGACTIAYAQGLIDACETSKAVSSHFDTYLNIRSRDRHANVRQKYLFNLCLRAAQKDVLYEDGITPTGVEFPGIYETSESWKARFIDMTERNSAIWYDILVRNVQSNLSDRYVGPEIVLGGLTGRFGPEPKILDVGCSRNQGLKALTLNIIQPPEIRGAYTHRQKLVLAQLIHRHVSLGSSLGVDVWDDNTDKELRAWIRSCSFRDREWLDERRLRQYDSIDEMKLQNVDFAVCDFTSESALSEAKRGYDAATLLTVLYQLSPLQRRAMIQNALASTQDNGVVIVQDFARVDEETGEFDFNDRYFDEEYGYRTFLFDKTQPGKGFQELWRFKNGRCKEIMLSPAGRNFILQAA